MIEVQVREALENILTTTFPEAAGAGVEIQIEIPREKNHGDLSTNVAMALARPLRRSPREIADDLVGALQKRDDLFASVEVAGPGFINFRIAPGVLQAGLAEILAAGEKWGESTTGAGEQIQVEFVSANPTGPLNVVSARAAAYGSTLTRLLRAAGFDARSEFYVNDVGRQIDLFGASLLARWRELQGEGPAVIPEGGYQGEYMADLAAQLTSGEAEEALSAPEEREQWETMGRHGVAHMLTQQEADLGAYGTRFDRWFRQSELYPQGVDDAFSRLRERGQVETRDGAEWFQSTRFGDDQDRVLIRANGEPTYFLADLA
jgi:arginyl-tRNA synthetase